MKYVLWVICILFCINNLDSKEQSFFALEKIPVSYKGRFRPFKAFAKLWIAEVFDDATLDANPEEFLWLLHFKGHQIFDEIPLFRIENKELKELANLNKSKNIFSYKELVEINFQLIFEKQKSNLTLLEDLNHLLDSLFLYSHAEENLYGLPDKSRPGEWLPLKILSEKKNFNRTSYKDETFQKLQRSYQALNEAVLSTQPLKIENLSSEFANQLLTAYSEIEGTEIVRGKINYPTSLQLNLELIYIKYPWTLVLLFLYGTALLLFILEELLEKGKYRKIALTFFCSAFLLHTLILAVRCYILERPPVSNMFETVIYVPWVAVLLGGILYLFGKRKVSLPLISSAFFSFILLLILYRANLDHSLENVQAVLNSQYWLTIHVLMVVGSYGAFGIAGVLGHAYVLMKNFNTKRDPENAIFFLAQTLYLGVAMLTIGTILGGVWAAQSWGRFWDWDPKESWAFISISIYLIIIHAYRFNKIGPLGLAFGSIAGFLAISFTWYGVNYILGTGLHSYGFGQGRDLYYWLYFLGEMAFIGIFWIQGVNNRLFNLLSEGNK